ncbi:DNA primase [Paracoccaceae bacterium GXU_MW_L88]
MSIPPSFLDELKSRLPMSQVVGRKVTWDLKKSNQAKGDWWAPCPFHGEKTASFHVDDQKGFYYCFGCQAKGNLFGFVQETENVGFIDAVEILAREAGMQMPARDPQAQKKADEATRLAEVMEQAVQFYRLQLKTNAAADARAYLERRGLRAETIDRFEIGFAPDNRDALRQHLLGKSVPEADIETAGLSATPDSGTPYDRFRDRIIFPIRDLRGRAIALGGRAMSEAARAKYLNSPETPLFHKGHNLYNHGPAREAAGKSGALIVAEGYMDVIALAQAGFGHAVAPLGTAITEDQLRLLWRITPEPVIALDGDKAGQRAAYRLIDLALPMLEGGRTLNFCLMPEGQDPDDLIQSGGPGAMQETLNVSLPLVEMLWRRETEDGQFDTPERRTALDNALRTALRQIPDPVLRNHYGAAIQERRQTLFAPKRAQNSGGPRGPWKPRAPQGASTSARASRLVSGASGSGVMEAAILAGCINHPDAALALIDTLEDQPFSDAQTDRIRLALLQALASGLSDRASLISTLQRQLGTDPLEALDAARITRVNRRFSTAVSAHDAQTAIEEALRRLGAQAGLQMEIAEAEADFADHPTESALYRLSAARRALEDALRLPDSGEGTESTLDFRSGLDRILQKAVKKGQ